MERDYMFLNIMEDFLEQKGKLNKPTQESMDRKVGKVLSFSTHIKYMVHAQLSNQEKWSKIKRNIQKIDDIFFQYDIDEIKKQQWEYFFQKIKPYLTRGVSLEGQMRKLHSNIEIMEKINTTHKEGGIDSYVVSKPPIEIIKNFVKKHKLNYMGISLICEYLKNVGVECTKPDTHIMRFLSKTRRGFLLKDEAYITKRGEKKETIWTDNYKINALEIIEKIGVNSGKTPSTIDRIIWSYCADGYGEICTKTPNCRYCIIEEGCNHNKPGVRF